MFGRLDRPSQQHSLTGIDTESTPNRYRIDRHHAVNAPPAPGELARESANGAVLATSRFSTHAHARGEQLIAWRERVGHVVDVVPSRDQIEGGFRGQIDRYASGGFSFTDCTTDALVLERPVARVSTDRRRDFAFHLYAQGDSGLTTGMRRKRSADETPTRIMAVDMNQPFRVERPACRVLSVFVPQETVDANLPYAESIHGQGLAPHTPLAQLSLAHALSLADTLPQLDAAQAAEAMQVAAQLLLAAYRGEARLGERGRAAAQAAVMNQVRRYVDANLHQADLTPSTVVAALQLKRATIYRWFEQEGGLGAYIRHRRLREAADELVRFPHLLVTEIAYGLGFNSASDFTRAFRRAFGMSPLDMRARALELRRATA
jgi:AraC-like DNA-binding protein